MKAKLNTSQNFQVGSVVSTPKDGLSKPSTFFHPAHKTISNIFASDEKNQINELISAIFDLKGQQQSLTKEILSRAEIQKLLKICNRVLMVMAQDNNKQVYEVIELERNLLGLLDPMNEASMEIPISSLNNCAIGALMRKDPNYSAVLNDLLNSVSQLPNSNNPVLIGVTYNNLAAFFLLQRDFVEAYKYSEKGLTYMESYIFKKLHNNPNEDFSKNERFLSELVILLVAYMNFGYALRYFQSNPELTTGLKIPPKKYNSFFANGYKLGMKYLGSKHLLTQKLNILARSTSSQLSVPEILTTTEEEDNKSERVRPKKPLFFENELSSNHSGYESSMLGSNDEAPILNHMKSFRIKSKRSGRFRTFTSRDKFGVDSPWEYPSKYLNQIKEMEATLMDIQQMREFYEREKRFMEEQNGRRMPYIGPPMNMVMGPSNMGMGANMGLGANMGMGANMGTGVNLGNGQNIGMGPNNMNLGMMSPQESNPYLMMGNQAYYVPNFNQAMNPNNQKLDLMNTKQVELEEQLSRLRKENELMRQEKEEKRNEFEELRKMIEDLRRQSSKPQEKILNKPEKKREPVSPCSSQNLDNNPQMNANPTKTESPVIQFADEKEKKTEENMTPGRYNSKAERQFKLSLKNLNKEEPNPPSGIEKKPAILATSKHTAVLPEIPHLRKESSSHRDSKVNFNPDPTIINKSEIEMNSSATFSAQKKYSIQKGSIFHPHKVPSSEQISPEVNSGVVNNPTNNNININNLGSARPSNLKKSDRGSNNNKKSAKMQSMDFLTDVSNPGILLKMLLPNFPRNFVIRKQVFMNEMAFSVECQIMDEGDQAVFLLKGMNETLKTSLDNEKLNIQLFSKILQTVDVKDVLSYDMPIKTMEDYEDFMRFCVMPFLGIGKKDDKEVIEVWPKAHGLYLNLVTLSFFGEECFVFFHHISKDQFRIVLAHTQSGKNIRIDLQLDQSSISKIFEAKPSKGGKRELIESFSSIVKNNPENPQAQLEKLNNLKINPLVCLETYRILDPKTFVALLQSLIKEYEAFLLGKPTVKTFFELSDEDQLILMRIKVWSQFNRYRMQILRQDETKNCVEIFMKNGFETHGNDNFCEMIL